VGLVIALSTITCSRASEALIVGESLIDLWDVGISVFEPPGMRLENVCVETFKIGCRCAESVELWSER